MSKLRLITARYDGQYKNRTTFVLNYIQGIHDVHAHVDHFEGGVGSNVRLNYRSDAESVDEAAIKEHALAWAAEHGSAFGEVEF